MEVLLSYLFKSSACIFVLNLCLATGATNRERFISAESVYNAWVLKAGQAGEEFEAKMQLNKHLREGHAKGRVVAAKAVECLK
jgi:hypothetical protein